MRELSIPSVKGTLCSFLLFCAGAALAFFSPEIYFRIYGVHVGHPGRYHFYGVLVFLVGSWILYMDVSRYAKKRKQNRG